MSSHDPYTDPASGVLRNKLGLTDPDELDRAEADLTGFRLIELRQHDLPGDYDLSHLQAFHRFIFSDVYPWAGQLRTVSIAKDDLFCLPQHIEGFAADVFGKLARRDDYLRGLEQPEFLDKLTELLADVNALHPFREGNGRAQRAFLAQLARDAGHRLRWESMDPRQNILASQAAHRGDNQPLRHMLEDLVVVSPPAATGSADPAREHPAQTAGASFNPPKDRRPAGTAKQRPGGGVAFPPPRRSPEQGRGPCR
ncbi:Fic family protein [Pseudonocardia sp. WMMC193]|uniref:Fic/DOC family protein n=1 Tax=Pseudonocardia sp. WMMC193 TaxID=2911965 RepID=UPI001F36D009|nr:Fic family protein [Pseudonocardia sp. WMMC193]MCF7547168.1 Fic family protein [Pseudonocardia sp. WMMC193]MCF7547262.1 Fic family protein [Pseudonocardia sp. WMMC193]